MSHILICQAKDVMVGGSTAATMWGSKPISGDPNRRNWVIRIHICPNMLSHPLHINLSMENILLQPSDLYMKQHHQALVHMYIMEI